MIYLILMYTDNMSVVKQLQQFGFSEKEARIYLSLLEMGHAVVSEIAKKAGINRSTAYILLESLFERKLVSVSEKNKTQYFSALPPRQLVKVMQEDLQQAKSRVDLAEKLLTQLSGIYKGVGVRPLLTLYEGEEGIEKVKVKYKELIQTLPITDTPKVSIYKKGDIIVVIKKKDSFAYVLESSDL